MAHTIEPAKSYLKVRTKKPETAICKLVILALKSYGYICAIYQWFWVIPKRGHKEMICMTH